MRHDAAAMAVVLCLASTVPGIAKGQDAATGEIVTDRPDETESPLSIPRGHVQLEIGWALTEDGSGEARVRRHTVPGVLLRAGVAPRIEARLGFGGWERSETIISGFPSVYTGIADLEVGFKYQLLNRERIAAAVLADITLPTGSDGMTGHQVSPVVRLSVAHELSDRLSTGYNLGFAISGENGSSGQRVTPVDLIYTWTFGLGLTDRMGAFVEAFGTVGANAEGTSRLALDGGLTLQPVSNLQLDLAAGLGLNDAADDWFVGAGVSVRVPR